MSTQSIGAAPLPFLSPPAAAAAPAPPPKTAPIQEIPVLFEELQKAIPKSAEAVRALLQKFSLFTQIPDPARSEMPSITFDEMTNLAMWIEVLEKSAPNSQVFPMLKEVLNDIQSAYLLRKARFEQNKAAISELGELFKKIPRKWGRIDIEKLKTWPEKDRVQLLHLAAHIYFDWHEPFSVRIDFEQFFQFYNKDLKQDLDVATLALLSSMHKDILSLAQPQRLYLPIFSSLSAQAKQAVIQGRIVHVMSHREQEKKGPSVLIVGAGPAGQMRALVAQRRNCSRVVVCDKREPGRENIVKLNKNDYFGYFPIFPIMMLMSNMKWEGSFAFTKIAELEKGMENCLLRMGVRVERSREWTGLKGAKDAPIATVLFWDAQMKQSVSYDAEIIIDTMGASTPLAGFLGNRRKHLTARDIAVVAKYKTHVEPKKSPGLKEHMTFDDLTSSTTLSKLHDKEMPFLQRIFGELRDLKKQLAIRERKEQRMLFAPDDLVKDLVILKKQVQQKQAELSKLLMSLLPEKGEFASPPECIEVGHSQLERSAQMVGKVVTLWAGDSLATGHPRDGQGINVALRAGAFARVLIDSSKGRSAEETLRNYEYGASTQISTLIGDF